MGGAWLAIGGGDGWAGFGTGADPQGLPWPPTGQQARWRRIDSIGHAPPPRDFSREQAGANARAGGRLRESAPPPMYIMPQGSSPTPPFVISSTPPAPLPPATPQTACGAHLRLLRLGCVCALCGPAQEDQTWMRERGRREPGVSGAQVGGCEWRRLGTGLHIFTSTGRLQLQRCAQLRSPLPPPSLSHCSFPTLGNLGYGVREDGVLLGYGEARLQRIHRNGVGFGRGVRRAKKRWVVSGSLSGPARTSRFQPARRLCWLQLSRG